MARPDGRQGGPADFGGLHGIDFTTSALRRCDSWGVMRTMNPFTAPRLSAAGHRPVCRTPFVGSTLGRGPGGADNDQVARPDRESPMAEFARPAAYLDRLRVAERAVKSASYRHDPKLAHRELCEGILILLETLIAEAERTQPAKPGDAPAP
jgi:hypothetical protein